MAPGCRLHSHSRAAFKSSDTPSQTFARKRSCRRKPAEACHEDHRVCDAGRLSMMTISPGRSDGARDEAPCPSPIVRPESGSAGGVGQGVGQNDLWLGQVDLIRTAEKL